MLTQVNTSLPKVFAIHRVVTWIDHLSDITMSLFIAIHESLPYIDPEPTPEQRAAAQALVDAEIPLLEDNSSRLPPNFVPRFSPVFRQELDRKAREASTGTKEPLAAIDLSRYEAQDLPPSASSSDPSAAKADLGAALARAYASGAYLSARRSNLALLDAHGRNAWLLGNYHLEAELRAVEAELADARRRVDVLTVERRRQQDDVAAELKGLEETWRTGVGRMLETEVAAEELRIRVLEEMRRRGDAGA